MISNLAGGRGGKFLAVSLESKLDKVSVPSHYRCIGLAYDSRFVCATGGNIKEFFFDMTTRERTLPSFMLLVEIL